MGKIILASSSPRRAEILTDYKLDIIPSPYVEEHTKTDFSYAYVEGLAFNKARAVVPILKEPAIVVGADTVVVLDNEILEKPKDKEDAFNMLKKLSGKTHKVVTSIAMINSENDEYRINSTTSLVTFNELSDEQIHSYIDKFKPLDKAGSYGIQELPEGFLKKLDGDLENVIGISSKAFQQMLIGFSN